MDGANVVVVVVVGFTLMAVSISLDSHGHRLFSVKMYTGVLNQTSRPEGSAKRENQRQRDNGAMKYSWSNISLPPVGPNSEKRVPIDGGVDRYSFDIHWLSVAIFVGQLPACAAGDPTRFRCTYAQFFSRLIPGREQPTPTP